MRLFKLGARLRYVVRLPGLPAREGSGTGTQTPGRPLALSLRAPAPRSPLESEAPTVPKLYRASGFFHHLTDLIRFRAIQVL